MKNSVFTIGVVLVLFIAAAYLFKKYRTAPSIEIVQLDVEDLDSNAVPITSINDKNIVLVFFATWCGPCISEIPSIVSVQQELSSDCRFILISDENTKLLSILRDKVDGKLMILHSRQPLKNYNIYTYPTSYFVNRQGKVVYKKTGALDWSANSVLKKLEENTREK